MKILMTLIALLAALAVPAAVRAAEDVLIVYDASGSMWGQIDGVSKMEIAQNVLGELVGGWSEDTNLGLIAYGHRREADCGDIETLIAPGPVEAEAFMATVNQISPKGRTPLSAAVKQAAEVLSYQSKPATVVLISDGVENCEADPCALATELAEQGVGFTAHVVGFDLETEAHAHLACIADNTGGIFVPAENAAELQSALAQVQSVVDLQPIAEPEPEPEPEPVTPALTVTAPEQATTGAAFDVSWSETIDPSDFIAIVPAGADEGETGNAIRTRDDTEGELTAPAEPGLYEVRYILYEGRRTLASAPIEVVEAVVSVTAPEQATTGAVFDVSWSETIDPSDFIAIVPAGADEGETGNAIRTRDDTEGELTAPAEPGLYEVRYILYEGRRTLASAPIEVVEAAVSVTAPEQATTGAVFDVSWSETIDPSDFIAIVPAGADEGETGNAIRTRDDTEGELTAPAEPGLYEVRYILYEGRRTLASAPIEVVEAVVSVTAPEQATTGAVFDVSWSETIDPSDFIAIVPAGADEGETGNAIRTREDTEGELTAPAEPGLYEVRYILYEGRRTLASAPIEVVEASVSISGPDTVRADSTFTVSWSETIDPSDFIAIVPAGADEGETGNAIRTRDDTEGELTAPAEPGLYELRYILYEGRRTLAQHGVEVVAADAPMDDGAGLSVPASAAAGAAITVSWTGGSDSADQRIALAHADQADFTWIEAHKVGPENALVITLPDEVGTYEIRYLDVSNRTVLGRAIVEAE